ncbi:MAG: hypothetical protein CM1200mP10_05490 [Candidatus Neomarinimicrobiota bacterium]|nr:MAG: hypothetical protein CM1200mP10_05490 [Candidatus Neomarinimicrobiota bacterium]
MINFLKLYLISKLGKWVLFLLYNTNKWNIEGEEKYIKLIEQGQSVIYINMAWKSSNICKTISI